MGRKMQTINKIAIILLIGCFFIGGIVARTDFAKNKQTSNGKYKNESRVASAGLGDSASMDIRPAETLYTILNNLRGHYVEQLKPEDETMMANDAVRAMLASLKDPNTRFIDKDEHKIITDSMEGKFHGIGIVVAIKPIKTKTTLEEHLIVVSPIVTGPAAEAGILPGDDITKIDNRFVLPYDPYQRASNMVKNSRMDTPLERTNLRKKLESEQKRIDAGIPIMDAEDMLTTYKGENITLTIARGNVTREIKLTPKEFIIEPITTEKLDDNKCGYIKINYISQATVSSLIDTLKQFKTDGCEKLILDMRNLYGGDSKSAAKIMGEFIPGKVFAFIEKSRGRRFSIKADNNSSGAEWTKPIVVLVNEGTAKLSEILAAALKDNIGAKLVGEKTFGDTTEVTLVDQSDGTAYTMATGNYLTSKGNNLKNKGLNVDLIVKSTSTGDAQLAAAIRQ